MVKKKDVVVVLPCDHIERAKWVDCKFNPKQKGPFEGYLRGEKHKVRFYFWTGRRWLRYANGKWLPTIFGEPGDKFRGLVSDPTTVPSPATSEPVMAEAVEQPSQTAPQATSESVVTVHPENMQ